MGRVLTKHDSRGRGLLRCQGDGRLDRRSHRRRSLRFRDDRRGIGHGGAAGVACPLGQDRRGQRVSRYVPGAGCGLPLDAGARSWILCVVLRSRLGCGFLLRGRLRDEVGVDRRLLRPRDIGTIYGGILTASSVAGFGAPLLLARSADVTGSYDLALYATGWIMLVGAVIPLALKASRPSR